MQKYRLTMLFAISAMLLISVATLILNRVIIHAAVNNLTTLGTDLEQENGLRQDVELAKRDILRATVGTMGGLFLALLGFIVVAEVSINRANRREVSLVENQLSERKKWEAELMQAQKMECVGRLAGGVAHDFNNLLTPIIGYAELTEMGMLQTDNLRPNLVEIRRAAERATHLTRQLLAFSSRHVIQAESVELNHLVQDVGKLLQRIIGEDIELEIHSDPGAGFVKAEPGQLEQVLINLAVNARDAMPQGGCLSIETSTVTLDATTAGLPETIVPGEYVLLAVSDTGIGMSEEVLAHIFEPFYTTKDVGKGTGLGLSTCYGIVKQSGGYLSVQSEPGRGTAFKVYLPRMEREIQNAQPPLPDLEPLPQGHETVLLVEDEPSVRSLASLTLRQQGYRVLEAAHGVEALEVAEELAPEKIDLLLTDVVMPYMGGKELAEQLLNLQPETRVLYTSGYTDEAVLSRGVDGRSTQFLQKPFSPPELVKKVRDVLDLRSRLVGPLGLPLDFDVPIPASLRHAERTLI